MAEIITAALPPSVDAVSYFLSRREADADSSRFLTAVVPQLAYLLGDDSPVPDLHEFRALWYRAADRAAATGRHLLLVVDGLDEDLHPQGLPSVASLLPAHGEPSAHVLVTSRLAPDVPAGHPFHGACPVALEGSPAARHLADLARQEIDDLLHGGNQDLAADVLGVLTAAAGPLAIDDLATLTANLTPATPSWFRQVDRLVTEQAARSLQPTGPADRRRYQFVHDSLLERAQTDQSLRILRHPDYRSRIHRWADTWREAGWPVPAGADGATPRYLLDEYPSTLKDKPQRFMALVSDIGWLAAALQTVGVDRLLADLGTAQSAGAAPAESSALLATLRSQAPSLRTSQPINQPGYVLRQLCMQAAELGEDCLAADARVRLQALPGPCIVPLWTTRQASRALSVELGRPDGGVEAVAGLSDGKVVSGGADGRVRIWDPAAPGTDPVELGRYSGIVEAVAVLPVGHVVSGGNDGRVRIWDPAAPGTDPVELGRYSGIVEAVAVLPVGHVVSGGNDGRVRIWDPAAPGTDPVELDIGDPGVWAVAVLAVAVLADGRVVSGGADGRVRVWDPATPGTGPVELGHHDGRVRAVAVLADGRVVSGGADGRVRVWDPATPGTGPVELGAHDGAASTVAVLADGRVVSGGADGRVRVWDPATPGTGPVELGGHDGGVRAVAVLADGRVVSGGADRRVRIWDPAVPPTGPVELGGHGSRVRAVAVLADGRVVSGGADGRVRVWDPATPGTGPVELGRHDRVVRAVAVLADGRVVSGGADGRVRVWDPATPGTGPVELGRHDRVVRAVAVLADGRVVSGGADGRVRVWDPATPGTGPVELGRHDGEVAAVAVLADGRVVSGGADGRVRVWDPATPGTGPVELGRHDGEVAAVAVLADGRVVSGGADGRVRVWDPATPGTGPVELGRHDGEVAAVAVLADGRVVSGGADGQMRLWDVLAVIEIARVACSVTAMSVGPGTSKDEHLVIAHEGQGFSMWFVRISMKA